ncbi:MAG TPA: hypothetical protein VFZ34_20650 [Blastocatellia bacterium]|nr:hypothetical protein [Blastocatellia bacterium]
MSNPLGTYSFLPWLRVGIANKITAATALRATIPVHLELTGQALEGAAKKADIKRDVQLFGPGDIVGIDPRAIVRLEPRNWITNFEPNYLPALEFYDEDFPWRYTPAAPNGARLQPWIALVVLKEGEFAEGTNIKDKPLPYIQVADANVFPPADQLWAWAHVHVNRSLADQITTTDMNAVLPKLQAVLNENPDLAYSRIVCPRKLDANAAYHAFLVPVFETGRLAGLGLEPDPAKVPSATHSAWAGYADRPEPEHYPVYYRWFFRTGTIGDFEYLARLLQPKPVDARVGQRDMDTQRPGSNLPGITKAGLNGVLRLGGALRVPDSSLNQAQKDEAKKYEEWDQPYPHPFQTALAAFINLTDDYANKPAAVANQDAGIHEDIDNDPDPLITPPLYGRWHALMQRLLQDADGAPLPNQQNWVHELNLDPRFRVPAGFGTKVVQKHQEDYMDAAWEQIGEVLEANRRIRAAQLAKEVSFIWHDRHLRPLRVAKLEKSLLLTAPVHRRVMAQEATVHHHVHTSLLTTALVSAPLRRVLRPRGRLLQSLPFEGRIQPDTLITRVNDGEVSAAPPKVVPPGVVTVNQVAATLAPKDAPPAVLDWLRRNPWAKYLPLVLAVLIFLILLLFGALGLVAGLVIAAALVYVYRRLERWARLDQQSEAIREENQTPASVDELPRSPDFTVSEPGSGVTPGRGASDSPEAVLFKAGLKDAYVLIGASAAVAQTPPRRPIAIGPMMDAIMTGLDPDITIPRRTYQMITIPAWIKVLQLEEFVEAMAYPEIDQPMYEPLKDISSELFLPNINLIEQNSVTLLETNQRFIEAYMVGLNHEFARELLWREYPTDQRGSYFRQFWDVRGYLDAQALDKEALKEKLRDIPPLHKWSKFSALGDHDHREEGGAKEEEVVLVIRGELLKKYPNTVVYAHRARWQRNPEPNGPIDKQKERVLEPLTAAEELKPPRDKVKTPLYEAKVDPDIFFFGFDLTVETARGGTGENPNDDPGWFFVLKERPGEPRFGLDLKKSDTDLNVWNDLSWEHVLPGAPAGAYLQINNAMTPFAVTPPTLPAEQEKVEQHNDDKAVQWNKDATSADIAYVLYQSPVLMAIHAAEMLPKQ